MAGSLNKVQLIGNLGRDPEVRTFQDGGKVCNLRIATSESWKDKQTGERKERTEWHSVAVFAKGAADFAEKYLRKGSMVYVEGRLETRKWQDQNGQDRYSTEVTVRPYGGTIEPLANWGNDQGNNQQGGYDSGYSAGGRPSSDGGMDEGDIPFAAEVRI